MFRKSLAFVVTIHLMILFGGFKAMEEREAVYTSVNIAQVIKIKLRDEKPTPYKQERIVKKSRGKKKVVRRLKKKEVVETASKKQRESGRNTILGKYIRVVRSLIEKNKEYPLIARKRKQQGVVVLNFSIDKWGKISKSMIKKKSSHYHLNEASIKALRKIKKFNPLPKELKVENLNLEVPISFKLL